MGSHCDTENAEISTQLAEQLHRITEQINDKAAIHHNDELVNLLANNEQMILSCLINILTNAGSEYSQELAKLIQIDASFSNLQTGNYGVCSDCDSPIAYELLQETPYRQRCHSCLAKHLESPNDSPGADIEPLVQE